jgi:ssRNA-specific RNase YbeY (16S rRNA maturation enzyme)
MAGIFYLELIMEMRFCISWKEIIEIVKKNISEKIEKKHGLESEDAEVSVYMNSKMVMHYVDGSTRDLDEETFVLEFNYSGLDI